MQIRDVVQHGEQANCIEGLTGWGIANIRLLKIDLLAQDIGHHLGRNYYVRVDVDSQNIATPIAQIV